MYSERAYDYRISPAYARVFAVGGRFPWLQLAALNSAHCNYAAVDGKHATI